MQLKTIKQFKQWKDKHVLLRVDFNVAIHKKKIVDESRIRAVLPTIEYLQQKGACIIIMTHLGRPEGKIIKNLSVDVVLKHLETLMKQKIIKLETGNWQLSDKKKLLLLQKIEKMKSGDVAMMENVRFIKGEEENNKILAEDLSTLADIFVADEFGVAHRDGASINGVAQYLPSYAGLLMEKEITTLSKLLSTPTKPFVAILGGIKMKTKIPLIQKLANHTHNIMIGGGIVNNYLHGKGYYVGSSLVEKDFVTACIRACDTKHIIKPVDVVVGDMKGKKYRIVAIEKKPHRICTRDEYILDIGPESIRLFSQYIKQARTLLWNGAMGYFEQKPYDVGTLSIARLVASRSKGSAFGCIGGGETIEAMHKTGMSEDIDFISTGGGAMLAFLAGDVLPGVEVVRKK